MIEPDFKAGFSAVELLISLFIAVAFLGSGYQLYSVIIKDSYETHSRAVASDIAYNALRQYSPQAGTNCLARTISGTTIPSGSGLGNASLSVQITCPYGAGNAVSKVTARVAYGQPQKEVVHGMFISE